MRFQVPQFIDVEDKIFGPLTFKQFLYVGGGIGICVILLSFLPKFLAILLSLPVIAFAASLAFLKINDKPFINMVESFFKFKLGHKLYIWKKVDKQVIRNEVVPESPDQVFVPRLSESKLKELTWELDIQQNQNPVTPKSENPRV